MAKQEKLLATVEPGVVADVDLANIVYTIPEGDEPVTPPLEVDEVMKDEGGSDVTLPAHRRSKGARRHGWESWATTRSSTQGNCIKS